MTGAPPIGPWQLVLASAFLVVAAGLSWALSLGMVRSLLVAAARAYAQLLALGFVLGWIFGIGSPWLVAAALAAMVVIAARTARARVRGAHKAVFVDTLGSLAVTGFTVTFAVTAWIVRVEPWYDPRYFIPIGGMVVGNGMNAVAVCLDRLLSDFRARAGEVEALLALGARPWEAMRPSARDALRAGLIPTLNAMSVAGLVFIPGLMTGQVLSGTDPRVAAAYQIVVLLMISAATSLASVLAILGAGRHLFDREDRPVLPPEG